MFSYSKIDAQLRENCISVNKAQQQSNSNEINQEQSASVVDSILDGLSGMSVFQSHGDDYEDEQFKKRMSYEEKKRKQKNKFRRGL